MVTIRLTKKELQLVYDCVDSQTSLGQGGDEWGYTNNEWKALTSAQHKLWKSKDGE